MARKSSIDTYGLGPVNGHVVGRVLKEAVRRATVTIHNERLMYPKGGRGGVEDALVSANTKAQEIYRRTFRECFPYCQVTNLENPSITGRSAYFTVACLNGGKAYIRHQLNGVGTMVAMVYEGKVISAYVGSVDTKEVYGYHPGSKEVYRITRFDTFENLGNQGWGDLSKTYALLYGHVQDYSFATTRQLSRFENYEVNSLSGGIGITKLWKGEVGALFLKSGWETPWDSTPIIGISINLGYVFLKPREKGSGWTKYNPVIPITQHFRPHDTMVVHKNDLKFLGL